MSKTHYTTIGLLIFVTVLLIGWDIYVFTNETAGDTISEVLWEAGRRWWSLPFAFGFLMGHLFWPRKSPLVPWPMVGMLIGVAAAVLGLNAVTWGCGWIYDWQSPAALLLGIPLGHALWANGVGLSKVRGP